MRVLVTGGNGFLGHHVLQALKDNGHLVYAPRSSEFDLRKPEDSEEILNQMVPDTVVHLAARVGGIGDNVARPGEFLYENAMMGLMLMENARLAGVEKFLTVGTACMYPDDAQIPMREDQIWNGSPSSETGPYAHAKRLVLAQGVAYAEQYDFNAVFVVPTNLYGPGDETSHVIPMMTRAFDDALSWGEEVTLWGSGSPTRDFLYVEDAAAGIVQALEFYNEPQPVNLGTGVETPIWQLAAGLAWEMGYRREIHWDPTKPEGAGRRCLDVSRALQKFGWVPKTPLREGIEKWLKSITNSEKSN